MSDDQDGCEWVNVSSGTGLGQKAVKRLCVCVCVCDEKAATHGLPVAIPTHSL